MHFHMPPPDTCRGPHHNSGEHLYIFITILLGLMITGFGVGVALCLRMPPDTRYDRRDVE